MAKSLEEIKKELAKQEKEADERISKMTDQERKELTERANRMARKVESSIPDASQSAEE